MKRFESHGIFVPFHQEGFFGKSDTRFRNAHGMSVIGLCFAVFSWRENPLREGAKRDGNSSTFVRRTLQHFVFPGSVQFPIDDEDCALLSEKVVLSHSLATLLHEKFATVAGCLLVLSMGATDSESAPFHAKPNGALVETTTRTRPNGSRLARIGPPLDSTSASRQFANARVDRNARVFSNLR